MRLSYKISKRRIDLLSLNHTNQILFKSKTLFLKSNINNLLHLVFWWMKATINPHLNRCLNNFQKKFFKDLTESRKECQISREKKFLKAKVQECLRLESFLNNRVKIWEWFLLRASITTKLCMRVLGILQ